MYILTLIYKIFTHQVSNEFERNVNFAKPQTYEQFVLIKKTSKVNQ